MTKWMGLVVVAGTLAACGDKGEDSAGSSGGPLDLTGDATAGAGVYTGSCGSVDCHGADGHGTDTKAEDLAAEAPEKSDTALVDIIMNGYQTMPPQSHLSDQEVADVLAYLRQTFP